MENNILKYLSVNYKQVIVDEISLEGLEGIVIDLLWRRVEKRFNCELTEKMKCRYWDFVVNCSCVSFYKLPEPVPRLEIVDRFTLVDEATGHLRDPDYYLDGPYEYCPVDNEYGSCKDYNDREVVSTEHLRNQTYQKVVCDYGDTLVVVASIEERWLALARHKPMISLSQMTQVHYCMLELIGKSRANGQMTIGKSNLIKIVKEPKTLFYHRKHLYDLDLIKIDNITQNQGNTRNVKALLVRLNRFHQPRLLNMPKIGILHNIVDHLLHQSDYSEKVEVMIKKGLLTQRQNRRLQKTVNIFNFEERTIPLPYSSDKSKKNKNFIKRRYICISSKSDESSDSEDDFEAPLKSEYKVGIGLLRQAYERFLDAGLKGLTQVQLAQLLGIEFYTSRAICRLFRFRNIVREFLEDRGKQRMARFIAVAATGIVDPRYAEEKKKFLELLEQQKVPGNSDTQKEVEESSAEDEVPKKKIKLDSENNSDITTKTEKNHVEHILNPDEDIIEISNLEGYESVKSLGNFQKNPTLRQLTFANGVLKVIQEKLCIPGYLALSNLAAKEINEPAMDTKALKSFIQKLVNDGYVKIYNIKWPELQRYSVFICASHIKKTDPLLKAKYEEICTKVQTNKRKYTENKTSIESNKTSMFSYPRYMKIQKLHELIMHYAYFEYIKPEAHSLPQGFVSIVDLIPEATVEFAINNLASLGFTEIKKIVVTEDQMKMKVKEAPQNIYKMLTRGHTLQNAIRLNIKVLAMLGLVQLVRSPDKPSSSNGPIYIFYVNRHAKILDTKGVWPRKPDESDMQEVREKVFYFETIDDVLDYWNEVFHISTSTVIKLPERHKKLLTPPMRNQEEAPKFDKGIRFGDGKGPCGFDSCFYMELPKFWKTFYTRPLVTHVIKKKPKVIKAPKRKHIPAPEIKKPKLVAIQEKVEEKPKLCRKRNDSSIKWSKHEDIVITICKAAITIMSPSSQPGSLILRNTVARDLLAINDPKKTKSSCHTRAKTLDTHITLVHEKQCLINEMRRRRNLVQKYEGLLKKIKLRYSTSISKFSNKARLPMLELVWIISKVMRSNSYKQRIPCVALNLQEFHNKFTITTATANKLCNMYKVNENAPLKEVILMTVMLTLENEFSKDTAKKIYATFRAYPEAMLRTAVDQLRKCGAIAAKEKILNTHIREQNLEDIAQSSYKISAFYTRKWANRLCSEFTDKMGAILEMPQTENDIKGSAEINCVYCEMTACDVIDIVAATVPVITDAAGVPILPTEINVLVIDTKYRLKTGSLRWKNKSTMKTFSELYQHLDINNSLKFIGRDVAVNVADVKPKRLDESDLVVTHLKTKGESGATFKELQKITGLNDKELAEKLKHLESKKIAKRVGCYENAIILTEFIEPWASKFGNKYLLATPWLNLEGKIRCNIFMRWCSVVMNLIFEKPGCSIIYLADKCEYLSYKAVQDICMFLEKYECITMQVTKSAPPDLFSDPDEEAIFIDFHPYESPDSILSFPTKNSLTKYSYIKKIMLDVQNE